MDCGQNTRYIVQLYCVDGHYVAYSCLDVMHIYSSFLFYHSLVHIRLLQYFFHSGE